MMLNLGEFLDKIEKEASFQAQSPRIIEEVEDFIKKNKHLIRTDKLPSIAQLERLRYFQDINTMIEYIIEQTEKKTHISWSEKIRIKGGSKPFWEYLLHEVSQHSEDINKVKFFIATLVDGVKIAKNTKDE